MERHSHLFLGEGHNHAEQRTWWVISLVAVMMVLEITGGLLFGSIALVADGLHMITRAAVVHVIADAAVLVIAGLLLARTFGWSGWTRWRVSSVSV